LLQLTRSGELDLNRVSAQALEEVFPLVRVLSLPFLFRDVDHLNRVLDGPIGAELLGAMNGKGLVALAFFEAGGVRSARSVIP
jgi:TRAP-type C4-dicarboxylate transport system substrate-binding protein